MAEIYAKFSLGITDVYAYGGRSVSAIVANKAYSLATIAGQQCVVHVGTSFNNDAPLQFSGFGDYSDTSSSIGSSATKVADVSTGFTFGISASKSSTPLTDPPADHFPGSNDLASLSVSNEYNPNLKIAEGLTATFTGDTAVVPSGADPSASIKHYDAPEQDLPVEIASGGPYGSDVLSGNAVTPSYVWVDIGSTPMFSLFGDNADIALTESRSGSIVTQAQSGSLTFSDQGASALPAYSVTSDTITATDSHGATVILSDDQVHAIDQHLTIGPVSGDPNGGRIGWTYDPAGPDLDFLVAGETVSVTDTLAATDSQGNEASADLSLQIHGPAGALAGFDTSLYPTDDTMAFLIGNTNLQEVGFYLPGAPSHRDASWSGTLPSLLDQGWTVAPIYVGRQSDRLKPADYDGLSSAKKSRLPSYLGSASKSPGLQGKIDGHGAATKLADEGFASGTTVFLDVESKIDDYNKDAALRTYIANWISQVKREGYTPGIYSYSSTLNGVKKLWPSLPTWVTDNRKQGPLLDAVDQTSSGGAVYSEADPIRSGSAGATHWQYSIDLNIPTQGSPLRVDLDTFERPAKTAATLAAAVDASSEALTEPSRTFVFSSSSASATIDGFRASGPDHDVIALASADFASLADVIRNTHGTSDGVAIVDPENHAALQISGVTKAALRAHRQDFALT